MKRELVITGDGSHSLFLPDQNEHYHSYHGAINESRHVFINAGLDYYFKQKNVSEINILEVGMGTGLNVFLSFLYAIENPSLIINYTATEPFPIEPKFVKQLNYTSKLGADKYVSEFNSIHESLFDLIIKFNPGFSLIKRKSRVEEVLVNSQIDIIYFDAFAPRVQPELWSKDVFEKLYACLKPGGILVTYCAKGEVKRTMKSVGFTVESLAGPPGKREMVRAVKSV